MRYKDFKKGDKVICHIHGKGVVNEISDLLYGINVNFVNEFDKNISVDYTHDGKYHSSCNRALFVYERTISQEDIIKEYKRLINEVPEVQFVFGELNYTVEFLYSNEGISIFSMFNRNVKHPLYKYISEEKSIEISNKLNKFMKGE